MGRPGMPRGRPTILFSGKNCGLMLRGGWGGGRRSHRAQGRREAVGAPRGGGAPGGGVESAVRSLSSDTELDGRQ